MSQLPITQTTKEIQSFDDITSVLTYYGKGFDIEACYITDLHLDHHIPLYASENTMIRAIVEKLYNSINFSRYCRSRIILFGGDIAANHKLATKFYKIFVLRLKYRKYLQYKSQKSNLFGITYREVYNQKLQEINDLQEKIHKAKERLSKWIDYNKIFSRYTSIYQLENYIASSYYKKRNLPEWVKYCVWDIFQKTQSIPSLKSKLEDIKDYKTNSDKVSLIGFDKNNINGPLIQIFAVLGNHEFTDFKTVNAGTKYYKNLFKSLGITLLCNSSFHNNEFLIYGGTGFAKYNDKWNATSVICCPGFTRENEMKEGDLFECNYVEAKNCALQNHLCFLCLSHYPPTDCLSKRDGEAIYFSGHNHRNEYTKSENLVLYADNQIGYTNNDILFKKAAWGIDINPYYYFDDGTYPTTVHEYLQFYRYIGESAGNGNLLSQRCENGTLYVIKSNGFYGFFVQGEKGISIVNGGKTKKICASTNIDWISKNFNIVVEKYYKALAPLRKLQLALSSELRTLGFDGTIHGCIVDIDFYNHIMVNPSNGELTFYYSDIWGIVQTYNSFPNVLKAMEKRALSSPYTAERAKELKQKRLLFVSNNDQNKHAIASFNSILASQGANYATEELVTVSRSEGPYEASRKINPLQRLFTGRVLRDFDVSLTEIQNSDTKKRKKSYLGCLCYLRDVRCLITKDDLMEILELTELKSGKTHVMSLTEFRADIARTSQRFDAQLSYWETHSLKETYNKYPEALVGHIEVPQSIKQEAEKCKIAQTNTKKSN